MIIVGDNAAEDADMTEVPVAVEVEVIPITGMITRSAAIAVVKAKETFNIIKGMDKITHIEVDEDSGMENDSNNYKARHAHKRLYTVLPKYSKIQVLPGITSCRLVKDNKQAIELNSLLINNMPEGGYG